MSKIAGNTTTRSNVFHVFLQVSWFEAYRNPLNGNVRIGAPLKNATSHRAFFVLDRSDAEKAYDPGTGTFRWQDIVKHRVEIN